MDDRSVIDPTNSEATKEVADQEQAATVWSKDELHFLLEASDSLAETLDLGETLARVAELAVAGVADWCGVDILNGEGVLERLGASHTVSEKTALVYEVRRGASNAVAVPAVIREVLKTRAPLLVAETTEEFLAEFASEAEQRRLLGEIGIHSLMILPLSNGGRPSGVLTLGAADPERFFDQSDLDFATELAQRAAVTVENAQLHTRLRDELVHRERVEEELRALSAELEARVEVRTAQLEAANQELEAFSYSVSHDLRAPLRAINGFARIVVEDYGPSLPDEAKELLGLVQANAQQMAVLIDDLLAFSRLGRQPLNRQEVDVRSLVLQVIDQLKPDLEGRVVDFQVTALPTCFADRNLLRQLLFNLLSNAVKFTRDRPDARVVVSGVEQADEVAYAVSDNGAGFDMRFVDKLFGVFQRLHLSDEYEGTGVGLAIVKRVAGRHGGRVWAEGRVDHGATFHFALPAGERIEDDG